jgi:hypothetical protein
MRSLLAKKSTLWFLFLFNAAVALAAGFAPVADSVGLAGVQQVVTCAGMGAVAAGAGSALWLRRSRPAIAA